MNEQEYDYDFKLLISLESKLKMVDKQIRRKKTLYFRILDELMRVKNRRYRLEEQIDSLKKDLEL